MREFVQLEAMWKHYRQLSVWRLTAYAYKYAPYKFRVDLYFLVPLVIGLFALLVWSQTLPALLSAIAVSLCIFTRTDEAIEATFESVIRQAPDFAKLRWKERRMLRYLLFRERVHNLVSGMSAKDIHNLSKLYAGESALRNGHHALTRWPVSFVLALLVAIVGGIFGVDKFWDGSFMYVMLGVFAILIAYVALYVDVTRPLAFQEKEFILFLEWLAKQNEREDDLHDIGGLGP
jgi:hypothetical protein